MGIEPRLLSTYDSASVAETNAGTKKDKYVSPFVLKRIISEGIVVAENVSYDAENVSYDDSTTGLGGNVQVAIDALADEKQDELVSGTNIKTVNGESLLGSGNRVVQPIIIGAATTIDQENLTVSRALVSDESGKVAASAVTATELGYVDGVTSAIQTQLNAKANQSTTYTKTEVDSAVAGIVNSAPETLDTLNELASALGDDSNFATTITTAIGLKADAATTYTETEVNNLLDAKANLVCTITEISGSTYSLQYQVDDGKVFALTNATSTVVTIPTNATQAFPIGTEIAFIAVEVGTYTITADTGVTLNLVSAGSQVIDGQAGTVAIIKIMADAWIIAGALA